MRAASSFSDAGATTLANAGEVVAAAWSIVTSIVSALPFIIIALTLTAVTIPWQLYGDRSVEVAERFLRGQAYPFWTGTIRDIFDLVRQIYNPTSCIVGGASWWGYGLVREVIYPIVRDCQIKPLAIALAKFLRSFARDILLNLVTAKFYTELPDWTETSQNGIAMFQAWINLYSCTCFDLADVLRALPILNPLIFIPPAYPIMIVLIFFSGQWTDPQTWCLISNGYNAVILLTRQILKLVYQILQLIFNPAFNAATFERPEFREFLNSVCPAISCAVRSFENATQVFWDLFVPFHFVFSNFLCIVDSLACILLKTAGFFIRFLINIDRVVNYPADPFWETVMKPDMIELINRYVAPTAWASITVPRAPATPRYVLSNFFLDTNSEATPLGAPNPVFGITRLDQCICNFITRIICDPSDENTACFSQTAQNLLMGLDFCCLTNSLLKLLADLVTGLAEWSYHLSKGPDDFFLFVDQQPFTTVLKSDLVVLARCLVSVFGLIPVVGPSIRELIVALVQYALNLVDFAFRLLIGLLTLPYFIINMPGLQNFLQSANEAVDFWVNFHQLLIDDTPDSLKNSLCLILNNGFPVPPIPCSSCQVGGFVPGPAFKKRDVEGMLNEVWGVPPAAENRFKLAVTPLIRYDNHTTNPIELFNLVMVNVKHLTGEHLPSLRKIDEFVDARKQAMLERWDQRRQCSAAKREARKLMTENPRQFEWNNKQGKYSCSDGGHMESLEEILNPKASTLTTSPVQPTLSGCSPVPQCFDLCCIVRSALILIVHTLQALARFFNGIIQGSASLQGTLQDYPYFTGELANQNKPTFQTDVTLLILYLFVPIRCACQVLNLIIPVSGNTVTMGRPDICCAIQRLSELIANLINVIINAISALALGASTNFVYFRTGMFYDDVGVLFDIIVGRGTSNPNPNPNDPPGIIDCLCNALSSVFPLYFIPGFAAAVDFDVCCAPRSILVTATEALRTLLQVIISLATITVTPSSYCYWRLDRTVDHDCGGSIDEIGIIKQFDKLIDSILPLPGQDGGACFQSCNNDNGATGIVPCVCQIFNTLIPWREDPGRPVNCSLDVRFRNCPKVDFCCPFSKLGFFIADSLKFVNRAIVALWQPWDGLPEFFINYFFCDEGIVNRCPNDKLIPPQACQLQKYKKIPSCPGTVPVEDSNNVIQYRCGVYTCGKLNVVIKHLVDPFEGLITRCTCQFLNLLDQLVALIFRLVRIAFPNAGWACCFCGGLNDRTQECEVNSVGPCGAIRPTIPNVQQPQIVLGLGPVFGSSGVLTALGYVVTQILVALTGLLRKFPLSCYWKPCVPVGNRCPGGVPAQVDETWIFSFLGPTANALCIAVGNLQCFAQSMFFLPRVCLFAGQRFLGSVVRWAAEVILRVIGFIEAFVKSFTEADNTCVGPTCDARPGSKGTAAKGVDSKRVGSMLVVLLSIPSDLLIGDADVACTTVCPDQFATVDVGYDRRCGCWNAAINFGNGGSPPMYAWTSNNSLCNNTMGVHVGLQWELNASGCCIETTPNRAPQGAAKMPVCQSPRDATVAPGPCVFHVACRPDSLPSCANDPQMPPALAVGYTRGVDGVAMGLLKYLRCLLGNLIGCDANGRFCTDLGIIMYPLTLIFSIIWQILGGVIRFVATVILFFFSLFTPPAGGSCTCYEGGVKNGYGNDTTNKFREVNGQCYQCNMLGWDCTKVDHTVGSQSRFEWVPCQSYCPYQQKLRNPLISEADALNACLTDYGETRSRSFAPWVNASFACSPTPITGPTVVGTYCDPGNPANCGPLTFWTNNWGLCRVNLLDAGFSLPPGPPYGHWLSLDICITSNCGYNPTDTNNPGWLPCGGGFTYAANTYAASPLVPCGLLQILQGLVDIFDSFIAIFTTPLIIPTTSTPTNVRSAGPPNRESIQAFKARMHKMPVRKRDTLYYWHYDTDDHPSFAHSMADALYNYDTSDCFTDPEACACRNIDMSEYCVWDQGTVVYTASSKKREEHPTVNSYLGTHIFNGTTTCDVTHQFCANMPWNMTHQEQKEQWVKCIDRRIQGERLHILSEVFPKDTQYNTHSPLNIFNNIYGRAKRFVSRHEQKKPDLVTRIFGDSPPPIDNKDFLNDEKMDKLWMERMQKARQAYLDSPYGFTPSSMMLDAMVKADLVHYKYSSGYYGKVLRAAIENVQRGGKTQWPNTQESLEMMQTELRMLGQTIAVQKYGEAISATGEAVNAVTKHVGDILEEGPDKFIRRKYDEYVAYRDSIKTKYRTIQEDKLIQTWYESPLYKWLFAPEMQGRRSILGPFWEHMQRVVAFQREHWKTESFNFFNADLHFVSFRDLFFKRWQNPVWRPKQLENLEKLKRMYYTIYNFIWPGTLSQEIQERFLFFSNCPIINKAVDMTIRIADTCLNDAFANANITSRFIEQSAHRVNSFYHYRNIQKFRHEPTNPKDPNSWIRPKLIPRNVSEPLIHRVDWRMYRRAINENNARLGPAGFNFYGWAIARAEEFTMWAIGSQADSWFSSVRDWILNPNTEIEDYPDVGLRYWVSWPFTCRFPQSVNCSLGIGLLEALKWVVPIFVGVIIVGSQFLPVVTIPFQIVGYTISFFIALAAVAWHYPPGCAVLFPSFPLPFGVAPPQCIADELIALGDFLFRPCYVPDVIPSYMVAGEICPSDPEAFINMVDCRIVGVSDGLQNILFAGYWAFGTSFSGTITSIVGSVMPVWVPYFQTTFEDFENASPTHWDRLRFCFFWTITTIALPLALIFVGGLVIGIILPPIIRFLLSLWRLFTLSPAGIPIPGLTTADDYDLGGEGFEATYSVESSTSVGSVISWVSSNFIVPTRSKVKTE